MTGSVLWLDAAASVGIVAGSVVALLTAVALLVRRLHQIGEWLSNVNSIVSRELEHNGGSSMKDQLTAVRSEQDRLQRTMTDHLQDVSAHASDPTAHRLPPSPDSGWAGPR